MISRKHEANKNLVADPLLAVNKNRLVLGERSVPLGLGKEARLAVVPPTRFVSVPPCGETPLPQQGQRAVELRRRELRLEPQCPLVTGNGPAKIPDILAQIAQRNVRFGEIRAKRRRPAESRRRPRLPCLRPGRSDRDCNGHQPSEAQRLIAQFMAAPRLVEIARLAEGFSQTAPGRRIVRIAIDRGPKRFNRLREFAGVLTRVPEIELQCRPTPDQVRPPGAARRSPRLCGPRTAARCPGC